MTVIAFLIFASVFFPPAWLAVLGYIVYLLTTKKSRRNKIIFHEIHKSIAQNREQVVLKHLYYGSAKSFAADHGASMSRYKNDPEDDTLSVKLNINDENYRITFQRWLKDSTLLTVETEAKSRDALINALGKDSVLGKLFSQQ
ncbi:hypothetical protein [Pseudomonas sp. GM55]|uniref:hypothetical protein n=1 Tax=Pseudomonas sp. GM55 TaxID=1144333 RepID=UPI0002709827|nr:hypothetical protein [Pseudomonas sp. GM55]EJM64505.1 hypothetical protein PMI31_06027 [Pseudomonas sp. GM55]